MHYPRHIGIIPDGNRTRAKKRGLPQIVGHQHGFNNFHELAKYCFSHTDIEFVTAWGASTENIKERSPKEMKYLYDIYQKVSKTMIDIHKNHGVGFKWIGSPEGLPSKLIDHFHAQEQLYPSLSGKYFILAVNYGGNDEIIRGVNSLLSSQTDIRSITSEDLSKSMDLGSFPPVDLVIRTKGEVSKRLSGFMTRRISYAELFFSDLLFPDFTTNKLQEALEWYDSIYKYKNYGK